MAFTGIGFIAAFTVGTVAIFVRELTSYGWLALVATGLALLAIGLVALQRRAPVPAGA